MHDADRIDIACFTYPVRLPGLCTLRTAMGLSTAEAKGLQSGLSLLHRIDWRMTVLNVHSRRGGLVRVASFPSVTNAIFKTDD
jgi:hypothetical protein